MKQIFTTLFLFSVIFLRAQEIPKGANTLGIHGTTYSQVMNTLLDSGFKIDKSDKEFGTIKTEYRKLGPNKIPSIYFDVRIKDSVATFSGGWRSNGDWLGISNTSKENYYLFPIQNIKGKVD